MNTDSVVILKRRIFFVFQRSVFIFVFIFHSSLFQFSVNPFQLLVFIRHSSVLRFLQKLHSFKLPLLIFICYHIHAVLDLVKVFPIVCSVSRVAFYMCTFHYHNGPLHVRLILIGSRIPFKSHVDFTIIS